MSDRGKFAGYLRLAAAIAAICLVTCIAPERAAAQLEIPYQGGPTMQTARVFLIFWKPPGYVFDPSVPDGIGNYESLAARFFNDVSNTLYLNILSQYPSACASGDCAIRKMPGVVTLGGVWPDPRSYPNNRGTIANPLADQDIQDEIQLAVTQNGWTAGPDAVFFVFTAYGVELCQAMANCSYNKSCAYPFRFSLQDHTPALYAYMPANTTHPAGCSQGVWLSPPNGQLGSDREVVTMTHEFFETISDPLINAWIDTTVQGGGEIGDVCAGVPWTRKLNGNLYAVQTILSNRSCGCVYALNFWHPQFGIAAPGSARTDSPLVSINHTPQHEELFWVGASGDVSSNWRDDGVDNGNWHTQFALAPTGSVRHASPLVAMHRNSFVDEVFWIGLNGDISTNWRDDRANNGSWQPSPSAIALPGSARADSPLVSINHTPEHEELFWVGADGDVSSTWRDDGVDNGNWHAQFALAPAGSVRPGSPLVVMHRNSYVDELFWIGANGDISTNWRDDRANNGSWQPSPSAIALPGSARAESPLAAINHTPEHEEIFWVGTNGDVVSNWRDDLVRGGQWQGQSSIAFPGSVRWASPLVATHRNSHVDELFWFGVDDAVVSAWRDDRVQSGTWQERFRMTRPLSVGGDSPLGVINHTPEHEEVFWVGTRGDVTTEGRDDGLCVGHWRAPFSIALSGTVKRGSPLVAMHRNAYVDEVFWIGSNGDVSSTWWDDRLELTE